MNLNEVYFWTCSIKDWQKLLEPDKYKEIIINNLQKLVDNGFVEVYGFVIMPNHIHLIWELLRLNGKEKPHASFNKATAHEIRNDLLVNHPRVLERFRVEEKERQFRIWQRDPLAINIFNRKVLEQKLNYIHNNPLQERWSLCDSPEKYKWSSASFYYSGESQFNFISHYMDRF